MRIQTVATLILAMFSLTGCIEEMAAKHIRATSIAQTPGFIDGDGFKAKSVQEGHWQFYFSGNQFTSIVRATEIAQFRGAQLAGNGGYGYFHFVLTKKAIHCPKDYKEQFAVRLFGDIEASPVPKPDFLDTNGFLAQNALGLQQDPSVEAKTAAYRQFEDDCAGISSLGVEYF